MTTAGQPEDSTPPGEPGQSIHKGTLNVMWGGVWVPLGEAEFLTDENNRILKVISYTPRVPGAPV